MTSQNNNIDKTSTKVIFFGEGIMNADNGHDPELVNNINLLHTQTDKSGLFTDILTLLACRDIDELIERNILPEGENITPELVNASATDILTHVCDDQDLQTILNYCRFNPEDFRKPKFHLIEIKVPSIALTAQLPVSVPSGVSPMGHPDYLKLLQTLKAGYAGEIYAKSTEISEQSYLHRMETTK